MPPFVYLCFLLSITLLHCTSYNKKLWFKIIYVIRFFSKIYFWMENIRGQQVCKSWSKDKLLLKMYRPNQQIKLHPTSWQYSLINYLTLFGLRGRRKWIRGGHLWRGVQVEAFESRNWWKETNYLFLKYGLFFNKNYWEPYFDDWLSFFPLQFEKKNTFKSI